MSLADAAERLREHAQAWNVRVDRTLETATSLIAFGTRAHISVVLKIVRRPGDEWDSGAVLHALRGSGSVRVYEHDGGALLLERLTPGTQLLELYSMGRDDEASETIASVIQQMGRAAVSDVRFPTVQDWSKGFERYLDSNDRRVSRDLVERAQSVFTDLGSSQQNARLLHGDLQHYNVLRDDARGWIAIDPKGVVGEVEYEIGAVLRNPAEWLSTAISAQSIERRVSIFTGALALDSERVLGWSFAQAVLSALWSIEDGEPVAADAPVLNLARLIDAMMG
jgi:streptomycin 6-kinase